MDTLNIALAIQGFVGAPGTHLEIVRGDISCLKRDVVARAPHGDAYRRLG
ncbi:MAG: hypothetical protein MJA27_04595 [Pseudanabaenales cyanobacterium]|nr:hypothetical protein [Pseudanabaenales cyanobacterium]